MFSSVYVMLDALDECNSETLEDTISLIHQFEKFGIKVFCTFRPIIDFQGVRRLEAQTIHSIEAHDKDVRNYLSIRLNKEWRHSNKRFLPKIIDQLAEGAKGKSVSLFNHLLIYTGFCLSDFSWIIF